MTTAFAYNPDQERDDHGRFGSGGGGTGEGLPRGDTHAAKEGGGKFQNGTPKEAQVTWAHDKAKEQGRSTYMAPNPSYDPAKASTGGPFKLSYKPPTKGEYHEVKPDGSMVYHPAPAKAPKGGKGGAPKGVTVHSRDTADADFARAYRPAARRIEFATLARAVEMASDGATPTAARLWKAGWNTTDKGDLNFTPRSAELCMAAWSARGNPLAWYYEHEDRLPLEKRGGAPMRGVCSAPSSALAIRESPEGPECWAEQIAWTDEAKRQIQTGERRQLSPVAAFDADTREIVEIVNVSLVSEGATHHGTLLASRARAGKGSIVEELIDKIVEALESGDFEAAENLVQEAEAQGAEMGRMARTALKYAKAGKAAPPPPPPPAAPKGDDVATKRLAAARYEEDFARSTASARADLDAATREAKAAAKDSRRATVVVLIEANRDLFDVVDEREHLASADPTATSKYIASLKRKGGAVVIAASRATVEASKGGGGKDAKPPANAPKGDEPTEGERIAIEAFNRGKKPEQHITLADFRASQAKQSTAAPSRGN